MSWFDEQHENAQAHREVNETEGHKGHWSHQVIGGAAAYEAMKAYNDHEAKNGKPQDHAQAKQIGAGIAFAAVERLFETKGLDFIDKQKAQYHAKQQVEEAIERHY
ncbi:cipC protein [Aspergillus nomiae NRRL 13137]|uniref:CipC protein n=1 Tax=Aspergillus nomiae NRRL (strain ATCC 15546 / NRRL 13137 / CBS 260.88 / M93) TaxID=1509407 RepID=A0A0L1IMH7_ASPN3|nr:cipC protein [Aspergillus nomiae NRRL 13137]KNG80806.1 cipC protein [Aspergillus nomiae NRRL 13137]